MSDQSAVAAAFGLSKASTAARAIAELMSGRAAIDVVAGADWDELFKGVQAVLGPCLMTQTVVDPARLPPGWPSGAPVTAIVLVADHCRIWLTDGRHCVGGVSTSINIPHPDRLPLHMRLQAIEGLDDLLDPANQERGPDPKMRLAYLIDIGVQSFPVVAQDEKIKWRRAANALLNAELARRTAQAMGVSDRELRALDTMLMPPRPLFGSLGSAPDDVRMPIIALWASLESAGPLLGSLARAPVDVRMPIIALWARLREQAWSGVELDSGDGRPIEFDLRQWPASLDNELDQMLGRCASAVHQWFVEHDAVVLRDWLQVRSDVDQSRLIHSPVIRSVVRDLYYDCHLSAAFDEPAQVVPFQAPPPIAPSSTNAPRRASAVRP